MPTCRQFVTPARVALVVATLLFPSVQAAPPDRTPASVPSGEAAVVHALNRLGFGPAPGDVARVREMGLAAYIEAQLHPERLSDTAVRQRLAGFETLTLDTATIANRYYEPGLQLRREIQRRAAAGAAPAGSNDPIGGNEIDMRDRDMTDPAAPAAGGAASPDAAREARLAQLPPEERARMRELRREEQKVLGELGQQKLLRAVYSNASSRKFSSTSGSTTSTCSPARGPFGSTSPSTSATPSGRTSSDASAICSGRRRRAPPCSSISTTGRVRIRRSRPASSA